MIFAYLKNLKISKKWLLSLGIVKLSYAPLHSRLQQPNSIISRFQSVVQVEDIAIIITILSPGCQQPFLVKMTIDNRLSAAVFWSKMAGDNRLSAATS